MNQRKFFLAIRHKPSGGFLPEVRGYGFTRTVPEKEEPPRLFIRRSSAANALNRWLEGEHTERYTDDDFGSSERTIVVKRVPHRKREDMEIVEVELIVRTAAEAQLRFL
jgi:hypothetical protein